LDDRRGEGREVTRAEVDHIVASVSALGDDNRAGIDAQVRPKPNEPCTQSATPRT
jgi:hypothetical protein